MPGRKQRTNKPLALFAVLLCLGCGITFTQSSATPSPISDKQIPDMFVAENIDDSAVTSDGTVAENADAGEQDAPASPETPTAAPTDEPTPVPQASPPEASPEAASGVWTPQGSSWYFMVNGVPFAGWLTDTDGERYYFDANGVMQTGWLEADGYRYYLNADGVLQTGDTILDGQLYHFDANGAQQGEPTPVQDDNAAKAFAYITSGDAAVPANEDAGQQAADEATPANEDTGQKAADEATPADEDAGQKAPDEAAPVTPEPTQGPRKKLALTFDDGPSDFTGRLLDCLEANNAKATFFLVGKEIQNFPEPLSRMEALGCEIGNHSYDHTDFTTLSAEEITGQLSQTDQEIADLVGHAATVIRPPYGAINDTVSAATDRPMILWSVDTLDWDTLDTDQTVKNVLDNAQDGAIILMHDIYKATVDAAEILIPQLIEQGYDLVTIHELAADKGIELQAGISYGGFNN